MQNLNELLEKISLELKYDEIVILTSLLEDHDKASNIHSYSMTESIRYDSEKYISLKQFITNISGTVVLLSEKNYIPIINRLLWECSNVKGYVCIDTDNPFQIENSVTKKDRLLWDVQANLSKENNQAFMSGWKNSYNNDEFSIEELHEYIDNSRIKLTPYLNEKSRVLEVGVGSGMIAFALAPMCKDYDGCDISEIVLQKLEEMKKTKNLDNISLFNYAADEIDNMNKKYDVILMSSVTEYFSGYNYMREVVKKCIDCTETTGYIFLGDIFDLELKEKYKESVQKYAENNPGCRYKKDFSRELFIARAYWEDLAKMFKEIKNVTVSSKLGNIQNEINTFRYDVLIEVDKDNAEVNDGVELHKTELHKYQLGYNMSL